VLCRTRQVGNHCLGRLPVGAGQASGGAVGEPHGALVVDHHHRVGEPIEDRRQLVAIGGQDAEALAERRPHRVEGPGQITDLVTTARLERNPESPRGHLLGALRQALDPVGDQRRDEEPGQDPDRDGDRERPQAVVAQLRDRVVERGRARVAAEKRAAGTAQGEDRRGDHGHPTGQVGDVAPPAQGEVDHPTAVLHPAQPGAGGLRPDERPASIEEPGLEAAIGGVLDHLGGRARGASQVIREPNRPPHGDLRRALGDHSLAGVGDEQVDRGGRDHPDARKGGAEPDPHADTRSRRTVAPGLPDPACRGH
jgi:hypothetical protein